jgi:DNA-binding SARP family transcriptional activator/Flp pilus assembly protein TadD
VSSLCIHLLGFPVITYNDLPINVDTRKAIALIAYLAVKNTVVSRDILATLLWSDYDGSSARSALRRTLSVAHKALGQEWLSVEKDQISLKQGSELFVDVTQFRKLIEAARTHAHQECSECAGWRIEAIKLYRDNFLVGFSLKDSVEFDDWQRSEAERLAGDLNYAFDGVTSWYIQNRQFDAAISYLKQWLQFDPFQEPAHYRLMQLYAWSGQRAAALRQYGDYQTLLDSELSVVPLEETTNLYQAILKDNVASVTLNPLSSNHPGPANNLPVYTKPFVGRQAELQKLEEWLETPQCRLLTIIGPGGIGKTRLSVEAATRQEGKFQDGVYLISLQSVTPENTIVAQIADAIGFSFYQGSPLKKQILDYLRHKKMLLVLDSFETCFHETCFVSEILRYAPGVKLLITSYERPNLQEEWVLHLQGLNFPNPGDGHTNNYDAFQMFVEYAQCVSADFSSRQQEEYIAQICHILEGIPLALELAAHWTELLPCQEIAREIVHSFDLLKTSLGNVPERHTSLRAVFNYSWNLLPDDLRMALRQLCIFQNGFTREASNDVAAIDLNTLVALVQRSMLWTDGQGRYFIPQIFKRYALEDGGDKTLNFECHSRYYANFLSCQDLNNQQNAIPQIKAEFGNILAGWDWAVSHQNVEILEQYIHPLYTFYETLSRFNEGLEIFARAIRAFPPKEKTSHREEVLFGKLQGRLGCFHMNLGEFDQASKLFEESLLLQSRNANYSEVAFILNSMGTISLIRGEYTKTQEYFERSLEIYEELRDELSVARVLNNLGVLANHLSDYTQATKVLHRGLRIFRAKDNRRYIASTLNNLGSAALGDGDLSRAEQFFNESRHLKSELGDTWGAACSLMNLGHIAQTQEDPYKAEQYFLKSHEICVGMGSQSGVARVLNELGNSLTRQKNYTQASRYFLDALQIAFEIGAQVTALEVLKNIATMLIDRGFRTEAVQILTAVSHDPRVQEQTKQDAEKLLVGLPAPIDQPAGTLEEIKEQVLKTDYLPLIPLLKDL